MKVYRQELSPIHFLERAGTVYADRIAVVDGPVCYSWREFRARSRRLATALRAAGLKKGDRIAMLATNSEQHLLAHFAVPLAGGVLVSINTRLSAIDIHFILEQSGATVVFYSRELEPMVADAPSTLRKIDTGDAWEELLKTGTDQQVESWLTDEEDLITINYTSGTTGLPKGVTYHHRGAYLNALAMALDQQLTADSTYLWTLPMFHCNGWTFTWALAAVGAQSLCIPRVDTRQIWGLLDEGVTHFCAAPTVLTMLVNDSKSHRLERSVRVFTAGAPPSPSLIRQMAELNFDLTHVYGLTETYGPFTINVPTRGMGEATLDEQARYQARQGFANVCAGEVRVVDDQLHEVPADGETMGEVVMQGNVLMKGYFAEPEATQRALAGGWFHSGDLAVRHSDGSIELRDRKKDIIISGGENISTIEVEQAVASHPAVMECAVVAIPDEKWGEVPKAFVTFRPDMNATEDEVIQHCRSLLAHYKAPKAVEIGELPKTSTGKIQKYVLREREWQGQERRIN